MINNMQIGYNWLKNYIRMPFTPKELIDRLTMIGLEAGGITEFQKGLEFCKIGEIKEILPHPNADKLSICRINIGTAELSIICGASNIREGNKVPVALSGANLPNGIEIRQTSIKGITSGGMLCSERDLDIGNDRSGIMILPDDAPIGADLADYLNITESVLEIDITPNRGDCLSHLGIAREIAAITSQTVSLPEITFPEEGEPVGNLIQIKIIDPELCFRYVARIITDVTIAQSPSWLAARLESVGIRSINNVVDITNFVLMETGQPLHAFDYDLIKGGKIYVRPAMQGERFQTLDKIERLLDSSMLMIADAQRPIAIAGLMGGIESEVTQNTKNILIESALFNPVSIRKTARSLGLNTEASQRFEKGVDPDGILISANRATQLILQIAGGKVAKGAIDLYPKQIKKEPINVRPKKVNKILGLSLSSDNIYEILKNLSFKPLSQPGENMEFLPPSFRQDIINQIDIVEEIARLYGYNKIPVTIPSGKISIEAKVSKGQKIEEIIRDTLIGAGFYENITYSFTKESLFDNIKFGVFENYYELIKIKNPLTEEQDALRPSLIPNLIQMAVYNQSRQEYDIKIFEIGTCFFPVPERESPPKEGKRLGILMAGRRTGEHWLRKEEEIIFYDLKGLIEFLIESLGIQGYHFKKATSAWLDTESSLQVLYQDKQLGILGSLASKARDIFSLKGPFFAAEVDMDCIYKISVPGKYKYKKIPKFPPVLRDMAVVVEKEVPFKQIRDIILNEGGELLKDLSLFDLYIGPQIPAGKKGLAFAFTYRSDERTLKDEEVNKVHQRIYERLNYEFKAELR